MRRDIVRRSSGGHSSNGILNTGFQPSTEFHHNSLRVCITSLCDQIQEFVKVLVNRTFVLEVRDGFKTVYGGNVRMSRGKFCLELLTEVFPVNKPIRPRAFFFPTENPSCPLSCSSRFHVRQSPHNFHLVVRKAVRTETDVRLA